MKKYLWLFVLAFVISSGVQMQAQSLDELLAEVEEETDDKVTSFFKSTRIMNAHSIEHTPVGELSFRITHRFGTLNEGFENLYGLDNAIIHLGLDYGITDWWMVGVGRSNYFKTYDAFTKFKILNQSKEMPVSLGLVLSTELISETFTDDPREFIHRLNYVSQFLLARKMDQKLSLQLMPTYVHKNLVATAEHENDILALGIGGRFLITSRLSINVDYFLLDNNHSPNDTYHPFSIGVDLETGGHVFQLILTNATPMREAGFISNTTGNWFDQDIHFGFNISRVFNVVKNK